MTTSEKYNEEINNKIVKYILNNFPSEFNELTLPKDESLYEIGLLDSMGVIELVEFLENEFNVRIEDDEITYEKMGSINKMILLIISKT
ncbi:Hypothetical protein P9215_14821 [Prochlorococcus marinus str. MIT 9215]|uniref:Carrier domain-containing protein n=1 Tax=Prochlorococcus marinus (strain MIT 9215) TaxID=93060 RepID=A8G664_PROM2|nr:phosphopantetheine-binding protein [Prochlorococcus marinus]ABV51095.1 Hypothetical protein P9215_14821 [Prochlorococcus marinus str. MIT 9215]